MPVPPSPAREIRLTHVVFDIDGTLVDFDRSLRAGLEAAAAHVAAATGRPVAPALLREMRERVVTDLAGTGASLREIRAESLRRVLRWGGVDDPGAVDAATEVYYAARDGALVAFDDVEPALSALRAAGVVLAGATNGNAALGGIEERRHLAAVIHAEQVGVSKPDPRFFPAVLRALGASPGATLSVGDRLEHDCAPALAAGMRAVLLDRAGRVDASPVPRITTLRDLVPLIAPGGGGAG